MRVKRFVWMILFALLLPWFMVIEIIAYAWHTRREKGEGYEGLGLLELSPFRGESEETNYDGETDLSELTKEGKSFMEP